MLQRASDTAAVSAAVEADGAVVVENFLDPDLLKQLNADLDDLIEAAEPGSRSDSPVWQFFHGANTKRFTRLLAHTDALVSVLRHPLLRGLADELLLPNCGSYWLNTAQLMVIGPGEAAQFLHRDQGNWPFFGATFGSNAPEVTVSTMIALTDFTEEAGATRVVPGSHRWDDYARQPIPEENIPAEMPAGSALFYTGRVIHGGGANQTADVWRRGLHVSFVLGWLTPEDANPLSVPWEVARDLPEDIQRLIGWGSYHPADVGGRLWTVDFEDLRTTLVPELARD
jgi:ectoine hydroxylase-related dioxygenase (phytanoyl-CoA dioxygenase family)